MPGLPTSYQVELLEDTCSSSIGGDGRPVEVFKQKHRLKTNALAFVGSRAARDQFIAETGINRGTAHPENTDAKCREIVVNRLPSAPPHQLWDVNSEWSTLTVLLDSGSPADRRWIRKIHTSDQQRFIFRDREGDLIVDSAGTPFDGGIPVNVKLPAISWQHNVDWGSFGLADYLAIVGRVNSDTFLGAEPGQLMLDVQAEELWEGPYHFVRLTYLVSYDPLGWQPRPANAGLYYIDHSGTGVRRRILINGKEATEPEPLASDGSVVPVESRPGGCGFVDVDYYFETNFGAIGLPLT